MARLSDEKIQQIRSSVDIVEVIGYYLPLTKKGKGYVTTCPFHDDKNPSLSISSELQIYKCFVCNAGGNVFTFLMNYLKITYMEAIKMCAEMAGIDISEIGNYAPKKVEDHLLPLYQMHEEALKTYQIFLNTKQALKAKEYLNARHIDAAIIEKFKIGFAPDGDLLYKAFTQMGFKPKDMAKSGLIIENYDRYYDRYKDRIIFPLWDSDGKVVGFSGRIYQKSDDQSKYMNSPESEIFTKGKTLYHYHDAIPAIKKAGFVYLLEGFMDVIALYKADIENAVAIMGTALTKDHLLLLRKVTDTIHLCLDGDKAGRNAMVKASKALEEFGFNVRIIVLKQNMDPDEMLETYGKDALMTALKSHLSRLEFMINYLYDNSQMDNYDERKIFLDKLVEPLGRLTDPVDIDYYVNLVSLKSGFSADLIHTKIKQLKSSEPIKVVQEMNYRPLKKASLSNRYSQSEKALVFYMMQNKNVATRYENELGFLYDDGLRLLANYIVDYYRGHIVLEIADLINQIKDSKIVSLVLEISEMELPKIYTNEVINDYIKTIKDYAVKLQIEDLQLQIKQEVDPIKKAGLLQEIIKLKQQ